MVYSNDNVIQNKQVAQQIVDTKSDLNKIIGELALIQDAIVYNNEGENGTEPAQRYGIELTTEEKTRRYNMYREKLNTILTDLKALNLN